MSTLSVRVSEDPQRPMGHAIVTLEGLPHTLETFEFALSRHGFAANHLGPDGWQGAECWLQPEEVWYSGDSLKFVINPDLAFQLENMPYRLAARGQGFAADAAVTFVWPLELDIEEGTASSERRVVSGTRVGPAPKAPATPATEPQSNLDPADLPIPDMPIPNIGIDSALMEDDLLTRPLPAAPLPVSTDEIDLPTRVVAQAPKSFPNRKGEPPTRRVEGRIASTPIDSEERVFGPQGPPKILSEPIVPLPEPPLRVVPLQRQSAPQPAPALPSAGEPRRSRLGLILAGVAILAMAIGIGGGGSATKLISPYQS
ncbi:MAG: hypothetical protein WAW42_11540, partial [Candidatus Competibacteraceae bacterium]